MPNTALYLCNALQGLSVMSRSGAGRSHRPAHSCWAESHNDGRLMVRCSVDDSAERTALPGAEAMGHGGRSMRGWVLVDADAVLDDAALATWVGRGRAYAASLPPKG